MQWEGEVLVENSEMFVCFSFMKLHSGFTNDDWFFYSPNVIFKTGGQKRKGNEGPELNCIQELGYSWEKQKYRAKSNFPLK